MHERRALEACGRRSGAIATSGALARQRGTAALAVTMLLVVAMTLAAVYAHRGSIVEQRASANQYAAARAFEAAEAGLQWVEAQLNTNRQLGADCLPVAGPTADSFRERYLRLDAASGRLLPRLPATPGVRPGCVSSADGFVCSCPSGGAASLTRPSTDDPSPAFRVELLPSGSPGSVRVVSTGCSSALPPCVDAGSGRADATASVEVLLGLLGAWRVPPTALLTAGGAVDAASAQWPTGTVAVHAGGPITVVGAPGAASPSVRSDPRLAGLGSNAFFAAHFGLDKARWQAQPAVTRVACRNDCAAALATAVADQGAGAMVWVEGDLALAGPVVLGSTARPVLIVVEGQAQLHGAVEVHGGLYATDIAWHDNGAGAGAAVHGALVGERGYGGNALVAFHDDPSVAAVLTRFAGTFARVSGSWRDF